MTCAQLGTSVARRGCARGAGYRLGAMASTRARALHACDEFAALTAACLAGARERLRPVDFA
jgi:hypothetical protein